MENFNFCAVTVGRLSQKLRNFMKNGDREDDTFHTASKTENFKE